jgi:5S rRNA maturation endonuclease (ribonuclease M5)
MKSFNLTADDKIRNYSKKINWQKDVMPIIKERLVMWASRQMKPTLRGLFYILVSLNVLENTPNKYDYLSKFTARARENSEKISETRYTRNGEAYVYRFKKEETLPIDCFADNVRQLINIDDIYESPERFFDRGTKYFVRDFSKNYVIPRWYKQPHYVEVFVEKDAMAGTLNSIINIAGKREVRIIPTRGQESVTFAWEHVQRLRRMQQQGKRVHIIFFGDLDPSGEAIEQELINKLTEPPYSLVDIDFKRVGVTNEQKVTFHLIPNKDPDTMAKLKRDTNHFAFMQKYNLESKDDLFQIEVDALEAIAPEVFERLVVESIDEFFDEEIFQQVLDETPTEEELKKLAISKTEDLLATLENSDEGEKKGINKH